VYLDGSDAPDLGPDGQPLLDDDFLVLVNGWWEGIDFAIPDVRPGVAWHVAIDTFDPAGGSGDSGLSGWQAGEQVRVGPRSVLVLQGPRVTGA
jgi:glycogen operon protein